jgi:hypothetical protein
MSGLAPLSGSTTTTALPGVAIAAPGSDTPGAQPQAPPQKNDGPNFTAFPSSYDGFGANGSAFGTLSVVNGRLSVTSAPPDVPPAAVAAAASETPVASETAPKPPPPPPPPPPPKLVADAATAPADGAQTPDPYTAVPPATSSLEKTNATEQKAANAQSTSGSGVQGSSSAPDQTAPSPSPPPGSNPAPVPTAGLLGAKGTEPIPGGTPVENDPALGLLGAPATNPIVIQAEQQQAAAAEEAAAAAAAADTARIAAQTQLQHVDFRIAAARADNNGAAVAQLQPAAAKLAGQIQGQAFAGLGTSPPQPFARPEIPTVFLNVAS